MAKKISAALREKLLQTKKEMGGDSIVISNKNISKMRLRVLPCGDEIPGKPYYSIYSAALNKGVPSPRTFGLPCPVLDAYDAIKRTGSKDEREHAKNVISPQTEYWMAVLDRDDMGTPQNPNIRILCAKKTVFQAVVSRMTDEDDEYTDVTDPVSGRDMRVRKVKGEQNPWQVAWLDRQPILDDEEDIETLLEAVSGFDVTEKFFKVNVAKLQEFYDALTGESIPAEYLETLLADEDHCYWPENEDRPTVKVGKKKSKKSSKPADEDEEEDDEEEAEAEAEEEDGIATIGVGAKVTFVDEDEGEVEGTVTEIDKDGNYIVDDGEAEWTVDPETTAVEAVEDEEDEDEDEEEAEDEEADEKPKKKKKKAEEEEEDEDEPEEEDEDEAEEEEEEDEPAPKKAPKKKPTVKGKKTAGKSKPAATPKSDKKTGKASSSIRSRLKKSKKK